MNRLKNKIKMSISIGFVAFVLIVLMYVQFKTVEETDITAIETMRETELRSELASWKTKYEELTTKMQEKCTDYIEHGICVGCNIFRFSQGGCSKVVIFCYSLFFA